MYHIRCLGHIVNLALYAFLLANSKEALQAVINTVENSTSEDIETALLLQLQTNSILSALSDKANQDSRDTLITLVPPATIVSQIKDTTSQAPARRSKSSKAAKDKANINEPKAKTDSG